MDRTHTEASRDVSRAQQEGQRASARPQRSTGQNGPPPPGIRWFGRVKIIAIQPKVSASGKNFQNVVFVAGGVEYEAAYWGRQMLHPGEIEVEVEIRTFVMKEGTRRYPSLTLRLTR